LSPGTAETAAAVINHTQKTRMAKRRKTTTKKRKEVSGTRVPVHPRSQSMVPYYYHGPMPSIPQLQSELQSQESRLLGLQNRLQGEQIAELEATIQSKDKEIEQLKATIQSKDEEIEQREAMIRSKDFLMKNKDKQISKLTAELADQISKLTAELAEGEERIQRFQEELTNHKVLLLNLATSIFTNCE
jgi:uncharacterized protein (DUF3084 family)